MNNFNDKVNFIWSVADLLRGPYKPAQYGNIFARFMNDTEFKSTVAAYLRSQVYQQIRGGAQI